jgi:hypothetical protein
VAQRSQPARGHFTDSRADTGFGLSSPRRPFLPNKLYLLATGKVVIFEHNFRSTSVAGTLATNEAFHSLALKHTVFVCIFCGSSPGAVEEDRLNRHHQLRQALCSQSHYCRICASCLLLSFCATSSTDRQVDCTCCDKREPRLCISFP